MYRSLKIKLLLDRFVLVLFILPFLRNRSTNTIGTVIHGNIWCLWFFYTLINRYKWSRIQANILLSWTENLQIGVVQHFNPMSQPTSSARDAEQYREHI